MNEETVAHWGAMLVPTMLLAIVAVLAKRQLDHFDTQLKTALDQITSLVTSIYKHDTANALLAQKVETLESEIERVRARQHELAGFITVLQGQIGRAREDTNPRFRLRPSEDEG